MNGLGSQWMRPSTVTWRSCIASSSAACVRAGVRLISSASSTFVKTAPGTNCGSPSFFTVVPIRSSGVVSGVNWMRLKRTPSTRAMPAAIIVFATPGGPSSEHVTSGDRGDEQEVELLAVPDDDLCHLAAHVGAQLARDRIGRHGHSRRVARRRGRISDVHGGASSVAAAFG